jgi:hypothetical protein
MHDSRPARSMRPDTSSSKYHVALLVQKYLLYWYSSTCVAMHHSRAPLYKARYI